ncbi:MAG: C39 family peptidase [Ruminococcus sp.]|nr:C39 family peptidase [Ruminococcus sp.]MBQ9516302.1 C39 family peptidase [Ruminococcus sp.]
MKNRIKMVIVLTLVVTITLVSTGCQKSFQEMGESVSTADEASAAPTEPPTEKPTLPDSYMIPGAEAYVIPQTELKAGCETYACTMLMNILGFDLDEFDFADNYLDCRPVFGEGDSMEGPDMNSGFAGTAYAGWGVYAPSMAKSMNKYLADQNSSLKAYNYEGVSLEDLCLEYIVNDVPVMIWATTAMQEPYVFDTWTVNYVDENAKTEIGDKFDWLAHEHCLVLIGFDEEQYYFDDSAAGCVSCFDKELVDERYHQLGTQCIVVK